MPESSASGLRRAGWLAGLPALALTWASVTLYAAPQIADRIEAAGAPVAAETDAGTGEPWLRLEARGRDLLAAGEAPDTGAREAVLNRLAALDGPRRIVSAVGLVETAAPFQWAAIRIGADRVALEGSRPVEIGRRVLEARVTGALSPGTSLDDTARAARGAPPDFANAAAFLAARLLGLAKGGRASLSDTVLSLSGEAVDVPAYEALRAALSAPPDGFSIGRVEILPPLVAQYRFTVEKTARGIVLDGFAPSTSDLEAARREAQEAAIGVGAGGTVEDRLLLGRGLDPAIDPKGLIAFTFRLADLIQTGRVAFADGTVSMAGDAIDGQAIPDAEALMRDARPAGVRAGSVALTARPLAPYRVTIRRTADAVTLSGHVPDARTRERVLESLKPRLFREAVIDRTRLAEGAPPDLGEALAAAIPLVTGLADGEVAVSDRALTLTGESLYRESATRVPDRLAEVLPPGWTGRASVSARQPAERRDPGTCRTQGAAALAGASLRFATGSTALTPAFYPTLDALAALTKACPSLRLAISGPADPAKATPTPAAGPAPGEGAHPPAEHAPVTPVTGAAKPEPLPNPETPDRTAAAGKAAPDGGGAPARTDLSSKDATKAVARKDASKSETAKRDTVKKDPAGPGKAAAKKPAEAPEESPQDLPRLRAQAIVEYLLQAGARPDQVAPGPDGPAGPVAFALLP